MSEAVSLRVPTLAVPIEHPHFGWKKFTKENVWWHKRWALGVPLDYWVAGALALVLLNVPRLTGSGITASLRSRG